jgi:hypothetical protein
MKPLLATLVAIAAALLARQVLAQIVFYEQEGLRGRTFAANARVDNFANIGFNDRASSIVVQRGNWEVCEDAYYRGRCITLRPGQYPSLRAMDQQDFVG